MAARSVYEYDGPCGTGSLVIVTWAWTLFFFSTLVVVLGFFGGGGGRFLDDFGGGEGSEGAALLAEFDVVWDIVIDTNKS